MADLATHLLRTTARAFYTTEHVLVIDALIFHSTLSDLDLAHILGMQPKSLRKLCGRLREDGLLSVQTRTERRTDGSGGFYGGPPGQGKERVTHRDWYYLNFHRAIDAIKFRMWRLNRHVESMGMPTTERKELQCPRCKSQFTELEVMDKIDMLSGEFLCHRCDNPLDRVEEEELANENESMKRLNSQLEKLLSLMRQIDGTTVPENDFDTALSKQTAIERSEVHPGARTEIVDTPNSNLQSTKGLEIKPEKVAVQLQDDETVKKDVELAELKAKREKEARQNAVPEWISKSTVSGDITAIGAKEERLRKERESHIGGPALEVDDAEEKKASTAADDDVLNSFFKELEQRQQKEAADARAEDEEEDDDEDDEFEDVDVTGANTPAVNGRPQPSRPGTGFSTPAAAESSNATDDERDAKRVKLDPSSSAAKPLNGTGATEALMSGANGAGPAVAEGTPAASDADDDEDELEFENV